MRLPSGWKYGQKLAAPLRVICLGSVPSAFITNSSICGRPHEALGEQRPVVLERGARRGGSRARRSPMQSAL